MYYLVFYFLDINVLEPNYVDRLHKSAALPTELHQLKMYYLVFYFLDINVLEPNYVDRLHKSAALPTELHQLLGISSWCYIM